MTNKNIPYRRFKGFTDDWEQRKLGDYLSIPVAEPKEITKLDELMTVGLNLTGIRVGGNRATLTLGATKYYQRHKGQLIYGKQNFFHGSMAVVSQEYEGKCTSGDVPSLNINGIDSQYLITFISRPSYYEEKENYASGTGSKRIHEKTLFEFPINVPKNIKEQEKVGSYFKSLDNLITLHQRKLDKLKKQKEALLSELFPQGNKNIPKRRFVGFTGDWEQRKLSDAIKDIADGPFGSNLKTEHYTEEKQARIIQLSNLSDYGWQEENTRYTTFKHAKEIKRCIVEKNELVMGKMMPAGMTIMRPNVEKMYVLSSDCVRIKLDNTIASNEFFLYTTKSESFLNQVNNDSQGSTRVRTSISKIRNMDFATPSLAEQEKIGAYFRHLDTFITLHQKKIYKLQNIKQSMLNEMFI